MYKKKKAKSRHHRLRVTEVMERMGKVCKELK